MKTYKVNELAALANITVRTLHHYDAIGLLKPAFSGPNGYRHYGHDELLRLQQILIHRELGLSLAEIQRLLETTQADALTLLKDQRQRLQEQTRHLAMMIKTIDRTIATLGGAQHMKDETLFEGIVSPKKQAEYDAWLVQHYGPEMKAELQESRTRVPEDHFKQAMPELEAIEKELAEALRRGVPPQSPSLTPLIERHNRWVSAAWGRACPPDAYAGLADVYEHPDFRARYESIEPGLTDFLTAAMRNWSTRQPAG